MSCALFTEVFPEIPYLICMKVFQEILPGHESETVPPMMHKNGRRLVPDPAAMIADPQTKIYIFEPGRIKGFVET